jgi:hypothetical protein
MQGRDTGIFTRKKRFFLISPNFYGIIRAHWWLGSVEMGGVDGEDVPKKIGAVVVSSEKCCKFAGQLRGVVGGKCADCSKINCSPSRDGDTLDL